MIDPAGIPQFTGDFEELDKAVSGLRSDAVGIRNGGGDVHSRFQMLGAYYTAPEADDLFASTQPVMDRADTFAADLETVADALDTFSIEARPLAKRLEQLKVEAIAFVDSVEGDDEWTYDGDKISRHQGLMNGVAEAESAFREAERRAATTISAIVGGPKFIEDDGSHKSTGKTVMYGYDAELLKQAKETPWGSPVSESYHAWEVHQHVKHFVWDGFVIDGGLHALQGLGHLFGIGGSAKDAWGNLGDVVSGIGQYTMTPYDWVMDHTIGPDEESATEQRQKKAAGEFAKSLVAWDQWGENPVQAAGTTTFNFLTLGAGPLGVVAKGSKPGAGAKAAGIGAKIGTYADPLSAGLTVGGKAISKLPTVAELTAQIRTGAGATADVQRVHSVIELDGGFKARVEDGEFIRVDAEGNRINETAPPEKSAAERTAPEEAPSQREPALVGAGPRVPEATAHAGENLPPQASHDTPAGGGGGDTPRGSREIPAGGAATGSGRGSSGSGSGPDGLGRTGDNAVGNAGRAGDEPPPPANQADEGAGNGGERELTAAERKQIEDELVRKANEDPAWREEHYDSIYRRKSVATVVDGVELPELALNAEGKLVAKHNLPSGPSEAKFGSKPLDTDTVPEGNLPELDKAAANRKASIELTNAAAAVKETPTAEATEALTKAQKAYAKQLGDLPNNSKIAEALGEKAAALHVVPHEFPTAELVQLPKTPTGANMFDQVYKLDDGYLIVEAKAPAGNLDWRHGRADPPNPAKPHLGDDGGAQGLRVKQGTRLYIRTLLGEMTKRGGRDAEIATKLRDALKEGKLQYVLVKAKDPDGSAYAGAVLEHLKIK
ncbi:hypothetical protein [Streptomyces vastus]